MERALVGRFSAFLALEKSSFLPNRTLLDPTDILAIGVMSRSSPNVSLLDLLSLTCIAAFDNSISYLG